MFNVFTYTDEHKALNKDFTVPPLTDTAQMGSLALVINVDDKGICIKFQNSADALLLRTALDDMKARLQHSVFSQRTEESSASQYFQFYGYLSQQQNMMQDFVRTSTYQKAILGNMVDFQVTSINASMQKYTATYLSDGTICRTKLCWTWVPDRESCPSLPFRRVPNECTPLRLVTWLSMHRCWY